MMMAVDRAAPGFRADLVELVAEGAHLRGVVFITRDDLVDRVDNNSVEMLIPDAADELRYQLIQRNGMTAEVPEHDTVCVIRPDTERLIDPEEAVDGACWVDFQVHIQHTAFSAGEAEPRTAFRDSDAQFHEQKGLPGL